MIAHDPTEQAISRVLRRARACAGPGAFQVRRTVTARDMETNRRGDERRELDAAESAVTRVLLATGDFHDDICLRAVVDHAQARLVADRVAQVADRSGRCLPGLVWCRTPGGGLGGENVNPNGFLAVGAGLAATENGAESDRRHRAHTRLSLHSAVFGW